MITVLDHPMQWEYAMKKLTDLIVVVLLLCIIAPSFLPVQAASCPTSRLAIGNMAVVEFVPSVALRTEPSSGQVLKQLTSYEVIDGPVCANDGTLWWKARAEDGVIGYAPEGRGRTYWVYPIPTKVPVVTQGAFQAFENGYMIWRYDAGSIDVFIGKEGGSDFRFYRNRSYARLPDNPVKAIAPTGLYKPMNGFGKLWGSSPELHNLLGWATGPEQSYTMTISHPEAGVNAEYYTLPDGKRLRTYSHLVRYWGFV
jgi:hypothetical protein